MSGVLASHSQQVFFLLQSYFCWKIPNVHIMSYHLIFPIIFILFFLSFQRSGKRGLHPPPPLCIYNTSLYFFILGLPKNTPVFWWNGEERVY